MPEKKERPKLKRKLLVFAVIGILVVALVAHLFPIYHVPIRVHYDKETQEVTISPGLFYTLRGYRIRMIPPDATEEPLLPLSDPGDSEYRFRAVAGKASAMEDITITARCGLTGDNRTATLSVQRHWNRTNLVANFVVLTIGGYSDGSASYFNIKQ